jgi:hypothetical protein
LAGAQDGTRGLSDGKKNAAGGEPGRVKAAWVRGIRLSRGATLDDRAQHDDLRAGGPVVLRQVFQRVNAIDDAANIVPLDPDIPQQMVIELRQVDYGLPPAVAPGDGGNQAAQ